MDSNMVKNVNFNHALLVKLLFIPDDFQSNIFLLHVVIAMYNLTEGALTKFLYNLEPKSNLVIHSESVVVLIIIKSPVLNSLR